MRLPTRFDWFSFGLGALAATIFWVVLLVAQPLVKKIRANSSKKRQDREIQASSGVEELHRKIIYKQTQGMHLAASLFALDEIAETPRLLAPPPTVMPSTPRQHPDVVDEGLPYLPNWPEIASLYKAPTLTIPQALSGGVNLIITGQPGAGKTFALGYLASQIVNRAPAAAGLHERLPFLVHVADLGLPLAVVQKPEELLKPIADHLAEKATVFERARIPNYVQYAFQSGRALLLLDGVDELPQAAIQEVVNYLKTLLKAYPKTRVIATGGQEYVDGLLALGFAPLALMPWNAAQQDSFLQRWGELWQRYVAMEAWAQTAAQPVDTILLNRWLSTDNFSLTPLEFTLKIWAAYAGDVRGPRPADAIEAHLRRLLPPNAPAEAIYVLGTQASLNSLPIFDARRATEWTKAFEPAPALAQAGAAEPGLAPDQALLTGTGEIPAIAEPVTGPQKGQKKSPNTGPQISRTGLLGHLTNNGILAAHTGGHLRFAHPVFMGYLAGKGFGAPGKNFTETLLQQPAWSGQTLTMRYLAAYNDATPLITGLLAKEDNLLMRPKLTAARLLRDAPRSAPWRGAVMADMVGMLQNNDHPLGLRGQVVAAFALSGDPSAALLFRQLLNSPSNEELQQLAALGAGAVSDSKSVEALAAVLMQGSAGGRAAACLALVQIGNAAALEAVATVLMRAEEPVRIAAAEALASHPVEGQETLRDGVTSDDILVRRAAVYGLARIQEPWADQLLEKTQTEDNQWAVRNVAVEIMTARQSPNPRIPRRLTAPAETPWLIEFAGKYGMGVAPGQPATDLLLLALREENDELRSGALNYLRLIPTEGVFSVLYPHYYGGEPELKEAVYQILAEMAYGGAALPHPMQYGLG